MVFYYGVLVAHDVLVVQVLEHVDLFLDGADVLLAEGDLLQGHQHSVVQVESLEDLPVGPLADLLNQLIALNRLAFTEPTHQFKYYFITKAGLMGRYHQKDGMGNSIDYQPSSLINRINHKE